jgi:hypothetical protein
MDARGSAQNGNQRVLISSLLARNATIKSLVNVPAKVAVAAGFKQVQTTVSSKPRRRHKWQ